MSEPCILLFEVLEPPDLVDPQPTVFPAPPVERLLSQPQLLADLGNGLASGKTYSASRSLVMISSVANPFLGIPVSLRRLGLF